MPAAVSDCDRNSGAGSGMDDGLKRGLLKAGCRSVRHAWNAS